MFPCSSDDDIVFGEECGFAFFPATVPTLSIFLVITACPEFVCAHQDDWPPQPAHAEHRH